MAAITPPSKVTSKTTLNAVTALLKWQASKSETQTPDLLNADSDELLYLVLAFKKIPLKGRVNAFKIPLPTPLHSNNLTEFCLIYDDRPKSTNLTKPQILAKIKAGNLPVVKLLRFSKLKSDYKAFESKRKLLNSYDMFLADKRIVPLLPRLLGKHFFKNKKIPVPIDLVHKKNWKEQIERICNSAMMFVSTGTCSVVKVARTAMSVEEIVANVEATIGGAVEIVPEKWDGIRSLHLKLLKSVPLPIYQTVPDKVLKLEGSAATATAERVEEGVKEVVVKSKESKDSEKVGKKKKKKGRIHEVRYLDSNDVGVEEEKNDDGVKVDEPGSGDLKKEKIGGGESDQLDGGEVRKAKRKKEKAGGEDVEVDTLKDSLRSSTRIRMKKSNGVEPQVSKPVLRKAGKVKDDVELKVEKPLKKVAKAVELKVPLKKSAKDVELKGEKLLKKSAKIDTGVTVKQNKDALSVKGGVSNVGKKEKRKSEPVKLKSEEAKLKKSRK